MQILLSNLWGASCATARSFSFVIARLSSFCRWRDLSMGYRSMQCAR